MIRNLAVLAAAFLAFSLVNLGISAHITTENNHKWCALMRSIDIPGQPATTPRAVQFQKNVHKLRVDLGC